MFLTVAAPMMANLTIAPLWGTTRRSRRKQLRAWARRLKSLARFFASTEAFSGRELLYGPGGERALGEIKLAEAFAASDVSGEVKAHVRRAAASFHVIEKDGKYTTDY